MELNEYQKLASRTMNPDLTEDETEAHALYGLCSEVGEVHAIFQKYYQGHEINMDELALEIGDVLWCLTELCTANDLKLEQVAQANIDKLRARYPEGFDAGRSRARYDRN